MKTDKELIEAVLADPTIEERFKTAEREKIKVCNACPNKAECWNCGASPTAAPEPIYKYQTCGCHVDTVEVERVTAAFVWIQGKKHGRLSGDCGTFYDTFGEAMAALVEEHQKRFDNCARQAASAEKDLVEVLAYREDCECVAYAQSRIMAAQAEGE